MAEWHEILPFTNIKLKMSVYFEILFFNEVENIYGILSWSEEHRMIGYNWAKYNSLHVENAFLTSCLPINV